MRKLLFLLLVLPVALFLGACEEEAEEEVEEEVEVVEEVTYELVELEATPVVFKELTGDYALFGDAVEEGFEILEAAEIEVVGAPIGVFHDNPEIAPVEELRSEVLFPVAEDTEPPVGYAYKVTEGGTAVMTILEGELTEENMPDYDALFTYIAREGLEVAGPVIEIYYWDPELDPSEYVTEIYVPVTEPEAVEETAEEPSA
ncbi:GyrI-like domain-containing protein [bacterium]|nr:GyrI-like domain-containing protein [bacterium]